MKKLILLIILASSLNPVFATVTVNWTMPDSEDEVLRSDAITLLPTNSVWQLIWSPDTNISAFNPLNPFLVDSSEILLEELRNSSAGFIFNEGGDYVGTDYGVGLNDLVGGFVYTRVFDYQGNTTTFNLLDLDGMKYAESIQITGPLSNTSTDPGPAGTPSLHRPFIGSYILDQTYVIPEPTTLMALLVGIVGLLGFRRHLQKK